MYCTYTSIITSTKKISQYHGHGLFPHVIMHFHSSPTQRRVSASCFLRRLSLILVEVVKAFSCCRLQIQCPKAVEPYNQTAATMAAARGSHCTYSSQMCPAIRPFS